MPKLTKSHTDSKPWMVRARERTEASGILDKLIEYIMADPEVAPTLMTEGQARAAFVMLKKVMPDLSSQTVSVQATRDRPARELTLDGLMKEWEERTSTQANSPTSTSVN